MANGLEIDGVVLFYDTELNNRFRLAQVLLKSFRTSNYAEQQERKRKRR